MRRRSKYTPPKRPKWNFETETLALTLFQDALRATLDRGEQVNIEELFKKSWDWAETHDRLLEIKTHDYAFSFSNYNEARDAVLERDNYRCKKCDSGERPEVHHIIPAKLECELWNMLVLCWGCHQSIIGKELDFRSEFQHLVDQSAPGK